MTDGEEKKVIDKRLEWCDDGDACTPISSYSDVIRLSNFVPRWKEQINDLSNKTDTCYHGQDYKCGTFHFDMFNQRKNRKDVPKTLFCHDLRGGYLEDRFVNGSTKSDEYRFFHWAAIDTFVYFSHQLVTIPPPAWINCAHLHGTKVLGTLITEWDDGKKVWQEVLKTDDTVEQFADSLVKICSHFGFDGYLLNVENEVPADDVPRLELFVHKIHSKLHAVVPHAEVIWYDSVTKEGKLKWQNELNDLNRVFFDNCDGIFLNYTWKEDNLVTSADNAGSRRLDVYVGVDVFGRNCFGGGGFNSCKAVELARKHNLSLALFAASWVHEYLGGSHFVDLEYVFWQKLWPYLYVHGPDQLPFSTTFCQGYGNKLYCNGQVVCPSPWYNLSRQQYQPTVPSCLSDKFVEPILNARMADNDPDSVDAEITAGCVQHCGVDAFTGGGCLQICSPCGTSRVQSILTCSFICDGEILVTFATKPTTEDGSSPNLILLTEGSKTMWILTEDDQDDDDQHKIYNKAMKQTEVDKLDVETSAGSGWQLRHHTMELHDTIVQIGVELHGATKSVLLGLLSIGHI